MMSETYVRAGRCDQDTRSRFFWTGPSGGDDPWSSQRTLDAFIRETALSS